MSLVHLPAELTTSGPNLPFAYVTQNNNCVSRQSLWVAGGDFEADGMRTDDLVRDVAGECGVSGNADGGPGTGRISSGDIGVWAEYTSDRDRPVALTVTDNSGADCIRRAELIAPLYETSDLTTVVAVCGTAGNTDGVAVATATGMTAVARIRNSHGVVLTRDASTMYFSEDQWWCADPSCAEQCGEYDS